MNQEIQFINVSIGKSYVPEILRDQFEYLVM